MADSADGERLTQIEGQLRHIDTKLESLGQDVEQIKTRVFDGLTVDVALLQQQLDNHFSYKQKEIEQAVETRQLELWEEMRDLNRQQKAYQLWANLLALLGLIGMFIGSKLLGFI